MAAEGPGWDDPCKFCKDGPTDAKKSDWIACDVCKDWFHDACVGITGDPNEEFSSWHCPDCEEEHGPSVPRRASRRKRAAVDYAAMDRGETVKPLHAFMQRLATFAFEILPAHQLPDEEEVKKLGIDQPIIVRRDKCTQLDFRIPQNLSVQQVSQLLGGNTSLEVTDVETQNNLVGWTLASWVEYFEKPKAKRDRLRVVPNLVIDETALSAAILRPKLVRELDLAESVWLSKEPGRPSSLHCVLSVEGAYTDFHIPIAGASIFIHVRFGVKTFLLIPPTDANLTKYEKWCNSQNQNEIFFADWVKRSYKVELEEGDSLLIPAGWIHAVYNPQDSLAIGSNFYSLHDLTTHLRCSAIDRKVKVRKHQYLDFEKLMNSAGKYFSQEDVVPSAREVDSLVSLRDFLPDDGVRAKLHKRIIQWQSKRVADDDLKENGALEHENGVKRPKIEN